MTLFVDILVKTIQNFDKLWAPRKSKFNLFGTTRYDQRWAALHRDPEAFVDAELAKFRQEPELYTAHAFGLLTPMIMFKYAVWRAGRWCSTHVVGFGVAA